MTYIKSHFSLFRKPEQEICARQLPEWQSPYRPGDTDQLPAFLRQMREKAGLTQRELAEKLGIQHTMIHNSETAERRVDVA